MVLVMIAKLHKIDELSKLLVDKNELAGNLMDFYGALVKICVK